MTGDSPPPSAAALAPVTLVPVRLAAVTLTPPQRNFVEFLRNIGGPVYAVLDATRDPATILAMLRQSGAVYESLYEGLPGRVLEAFAPYLVHLEGVHLLEYLVAHGWRKNWGIFIVSVAEFRVLRRHLRTFLMVDGPDGEPLYFRYYDPRVLRAYLPTCDAGEAEMLFGPVNAYVCESDKPETFDVFQYDGAFLEQDSIPMKGG